MSFLQYLATLRSPALNSVFQFITNLGMPTFAILFFGWFYLNINKKDARILSYGFLFSTIVCQGMKIHFRIPRPWVLDPGFEVVESAKSSATGYSFPSGHSQTAISIYGSLAWLCRNKVLKVLFIAIIPLVAFSRMFLGCHTPMDVGVGLLAGGLITLLIWFVWYRYNSLPQLNNIFLAVLLGASLILLFMTVALYSNGTIDFLNSKDSIQTVGAAAGTIAAFLLEGRLIHFSVEGTLKQKVLRFLICMAGVLIITFAIKALGGSSFILLFLRYALTMLYIGAGAPAICVKLGLAQKEDSSRTVPTL